MEKNKGIRICRTDIYLEFPKLMKEEYIELCNFLNEEHIRYNGATQKFKEQKDKIMRLNDKIYGKDEYIKMLEKKIKRLTSENKELKDRLYKITTKFN